MREDYLSIAKALYKPTPKVEGLVLKLCDLFDKPLPNGVTITSLTFKEGSLKIGNLSVKELIRGGQHCGIEVHWYPNFNVSTKNDPYCSAYILHNHEIRKLIHHVNHIHDYYEKVTICK
jgi:hypothetical protein